MSNLQKLLEKLAGSDHPAEVGADEDRVKYADPVYIEKLAAAVDFIIERNVDALEKRANIEKVHALVAKGMALPAAVKAAYPEYSTEEVNALVAKLKQGDAEPSGSPETSPVSDEGEKTSSINRALLKSLVANKTKIASAELAAPDTSPSISVDAIRSKLKEKLASTAASRSSGDFKVIDSVMSRLKELTSETAAIEVKDSSEFDSVKAKALEEIGTEEAAEVKVEEVARAAAEDTTKTASKSLTLAEMLKSAASDKSDSTDESAISSGVKTAEDQGISVSSFLRSSVRQKAGRVEV